jgi:hypothetical protein
MSRVQDGAQTGYEYHLGLTSNYLDGHAAVNVSLYGDTNIVCNSSRRRA